MSKQFGIDSKFKLAMNQFHPLYNANRPVHAQSNQMFQWMRSNYSPDHIEKKFKGDPRRIYQKMMQYVSQQSYWHRVIHVRFYNNQSGELIYEGFVNNGKKD